ncbi:site-specific integrase [Rhodococcus sp. I2R]|jgi:integrase|uniref:tyrosine-type recombinase/integrase n=1 Tax=Rhodococcus sp. I2R TaxID=2855445 RepID=UPI001E5512BA|nr:site-specific integrase [Rhodococcus sp. I2R]MCC8927139.1 site-specific integrase [Rhodococcus sp. I2R]
MSKRRGWGTVKRRTPKSGRYRASYIGPDGKRYAADHTYAAKVDADAWLSSERALITAGVWTPPTDRVTTAGKTLLAYAEARIAQRTLTPRTRRGYEETLKNHIAPALGDVPLTELTVTRIRDWYAALLPDKPTARAHAYGLLHSVCHDAVKEQLISTNPCVERKAMSAKRTRKIRALTAAQLTEVAEHSPDNLKAAVLIGGWCGLRAGELKGLRRMDIAEDGSVVSVRQAVTYRGGDYYPGTPKTEAGVRDVAVPTRIRAVVLHHLSEYTGTNPASLVFPGPDDGYMTDWQLRRAVAAAGNAVGIENLRPHELRHTAATLAAQTGATTKELMSRIGHATADAALLYQHASAERDAEIARKLDEM